MVPAREHRFGKMLTRLLVSRLQIGSRAVVSSIPDVEHPTKNGTLLGFKVSRCRISRLRLKATVINYIVTTWPWVAQSKNVNASEVLHVRFCSSVLDHFRRALPA